MPKRERRIEERRKEQRRRNNRGIIDKRKLDRRQKNEDQIYEDQIEGRNAVIELLETEKTINKLYISKGEKVRFNQ